MKNLTKIICVVLCVIMFMQMVVFANTNEEKNYTDYQSAIKVLDNLGITKGIHFNSQAESFVTRYEFAVLITRMLNVDVSEYTSSRVINDVTEEQYPFAAYLMDNGIILGNGIGDFFPDVDITVNQALTIMMRILGYDVIAKYKGGQEAFYVEVSSKLGLDNGIIRHLDDRLQLKYLYQIIYNTLHTQMYVQTLFGTEIKFESDPDRTLLYDRFDIKFSEGTINATEISAIDGKIADAGCVIIDSVSYYAQDTNAKAFFGYYVNAYYTEKTSGIRKLLFINELEYCTSYTYNSSELVYENYEYNYQGENGKETSYKFSEDFVTIINGEFTTYSKDNMIPGSGTITLVNTDSDNKIELVLIRNERIEIANSYNPSEEIISLKFDGKPIELKKYDEENIHVFNSKNEPDELSSIREWSVLTILDNGKDITIYISNDNVKGTVSEIYDTLGIICVKIGEDNFEISPLSKTKAPNLSDAGTFLLDINGRIAHFREGSIWNYGFIFGAEKGSSLDSVYKFKIFDSTCNDESLILSAAKKVTVNGIKCSQEGIDANGNNKFESILTTPQVIRYKSTSKGSVSEIQTVGNGFEVLDKETNPLQENQFTTSELRWRNNTFGHRYAIDADTAIFFAPDTKDAQDKETGYIDFDNEEDFEAIDTTALSNNVSYKIIPYVADPDNDITADFVVVKKKVSVHSNSPHVIVEGIVKKLNAEDEVVECLKVFNNDGTLTYVEGLTNTYFTDKGIEEKDVIIYYERNGILQDVVLVYDESDGDGKIKDSKYLNEPGQWYEGRNFVKADIQKIQGTMMQLVDFNGTKDLVLAIDQAKVIICKDSVGRTQFSLGTISDLKDIAHFGYSSDVLMYVTEDTTKFIYIYEE